MSETKDNLNVEIELETKKRAEKLLEYLGLTIEQAINLFLKQVIITKGIPFEIKTPEFYYEPLEDDENTRSIYISPITHKSYDTLEELEADLKAYKLQGGENDQFINRKF